MFSITFLCISLLSIHSAEGVVKKLDESINFWTVIDKFEKFGIKQQYIVEEVLYTQCILFTYILQCFIPFQKLSYILL